MAVILPSSLQQDVQGSLPIIPNNGNPGGAYNMPSPEAPVQEAVPQDPYSWLKASPYMEQVKAMLLGNEERIRRSMFDIVNPQEKQDWQMNMVGGEMHVVPLNDYGLPMREEDGDPFLSWPLPNEAVELPQYRPILPGE